MSRFRRSLVIVLVVLFTTQCVVKKAEFGPVPTGVPTVVTSPVRAHLKDGSTVIYASGVTVTRDALEGPGISYDLMRTAPRDVTRVALTDVVGIETFRSSTDGGKSAGMTALGLLSIAATPFLLLAMFGSCPTVYSGDGEEDEAELFSTSISPLFESRDIDRLKARPDINGRLTLEIRNEALETHYINHLHAIEARHRSDEFVVPNTEGVPVAVGGLTAIPSAVNRRGRNVTDALSNSVDGRFYSTEFETLRQATSSDTKDWIEMMVPVAPGVSETALVFRVRNSLLNTVLLYDVMLGRSGASALDWMGKGINEVSKAVELGRWHQEHAGLHVQVWEGDGYRTVARVPDAGPISWRDVAAILPVPPAQTSLRVRLSFTADHVRIDRVAVGSPKAVGLRAIALSQVTESTGKTNGQALAEMRLPDTDYLQTLPGQRFYAHFETGPAPGTGSRTFFLGSQGYYTEWIRPSWIQSATDNAPFTPSNDALLDAIRRWSGKRESFEKQFFSSKVPVR